MSEMTITEMRLRIAELESTLAPKQRAVTKAAAKAEKARVKAQKRVWKLEAWHRARLSSTLNRYYV
jgi:hypothetical protein